MNDEPTSSASAAYSHDQDGHVQSETAPTAAELAERRKSNRQMFNKKRGELLDDLLRNFDILVYAELSVIYYMEYAYLYSRQTNVVLIHTVAVHSSNSSSEPSCSSCS